MPYLKTLADVARRTGYPVTEVPGWAGRGHGPQPDVRGVVAHHTAGPSGGGDYPSLGVVRDGRPGLDGPLSHFGLGRSGRIYVIAAGRCWHNAPSTSPDHTNSASIGIEAENDGRQNWPAAQLDAYIKLCGELCREFSLGAGAVKGHKEVNTHKPDPHSLSMADFRSQVQRVLDNGPEAEDEVPEHVRFQGRGLDVVLPPGEWRYLPFTLRNSEELDELYYSVLFKRARYSASAAVRLRGADRLALEPGTEIQIRAVEVTLKGGDWEPVERAPIDSSAHRSGAAHFAHTWNGNNQEGNRLRFQVAQFGDRPALLDWTDASVLSWPY